MIKKFIICAVILLSMLCASSLRAEDDVPVVEQSVGAVELKPRPSPQLWSIELKTGFWLPQSVVLDSFFTKCCNLITRVEGGLLITKRYGVEAGVGFLYKSAQAVGAISGQPSQDRFNFILIPMETNFVWRADYFSWRYLVPYIKIGPDYVYFREGDKGHTTQGVKFGLHGAGGLAINVGEIADVNKSMDSDFGINDLFVTLEGRYQWINNFGGSGLDLSGGVYSIGLLFEF